MTSISNTIIQIRDVTECDDYLADCFDKKWGESKLKSLTAMYLVHRDLYGYCLDINDREWMRTKEVTGAVLEHYGGSLNMFQKKHSYAVLHSLVEDHGMIDRIYNPLRFAINRQGFHCAVCIINNNWIQPNN